MLSGAEQDPERQLGALRGLGARLGSRTNPLLHKGVPMAQPGDDPLIPMQGRITCLCPLRGCNLRCHAPTGPGRACA